MKRRKRNVNNATKLIKHPPHSKKGKNKSNGVDKPKLIYNSKIATKFIFDKLPPYLKKERKITRDKVALILFLFDLYRLKSGLITGDEFFPEWSKRSNKKKFVEDEIDMVDFVNELSHANCISSDKKTLERVWELEIDYCISVGIIDISKKTKRKE